MIYKDIIASIIMTKPDKMPFDLEIHILEQKLKKAQSNTNKAIKKICK